jgi:hypothetical protein
MHCEVAAEERENKNEGTDTYGSHDHNSETSVPVDSG